MEDIFIRKSIDQVCRCQWDHICHYTLDSHKQSCFMRERKLSYPSKASGKTLVQPQKREAHLPSQKRPARYILESSPNTTVEQHQPWSTVVENCVEKDSWSLTVLCTYPAVSLLQLKQSKKLSGFLLCIVLLKTQYLREPWALSACYLSKESEDTFSEMVGKCSVQMHSPGRCQNQDDT